LSTLISSVEDGVGRLVLNRPEKRNAIDDDTRAALTERLASFETDISVRVVILSGTGPAFCAGTDLGAQGKAASRPRLSEPLDRFIKPVLAAINGVAVGGGLELALACDMRIAATTARFGLPEATIGSLAGSGGTQRLPIAVGPALAAQMLFTGEMISAERAREAGLVSEVVEPDQLMDRALAIARTVADNAPLSVLAVKRALRAAIDDRLASGLDLERSLFLDLAGTADREEGRAAFRERRKPVFQGK